jgi:hypothetical protein
MTLSMQRRPATFFRVAPDARNPPGATEGEQWRASSKEGGVLNIIIEVASFHAHPKGSPPRTIGQGAASASLLYILNAAISPCGQQAGVCLSPRNPHKDAGHFIHAIFLRTRGVLGSHPTLLDRTAPPMSAVAREEEFMSINFTEIILAASILGLAVGFAVL